MFWYLPVTGTKVSVDHTLGHADDVRYDHYLNTNGLTGFSRSKSSGLGGIIVEKFQ